MLLPGGCSRYGLLNVYLGSNSYCCIIHLSMYTVDTIPSTLEGWFDKRWSDYRFWQHPRNGPEASHSKPWCMPTHPWLSQVQQWMEIVSKEARVITHLTLSLDSIHWSLWYSLSSRLAVQRGLQRLQEPRATLPTLSCTSTWAYDDVQLPVFGVSTSPRHTTS